VDAPNPCACRAKCGSSGAGHIAGRHAGIAICFAGADPVDLRFNAGAHHYTATGSVKKQLPGRLALIFGIATIFAVIALGIASPPGVSGDAKTYYYVGGHLFGIGEQQVYLIDRDSILTVRYRTALGGVQSTTFHRRVQSSVAWTIEGLASGGGPILGLATAPPTPEGVVSISTLQPVRSTLPSTPPPPSPEPSGESPRPSPMLDAHGATAPTGALADLAPASILLSGITGDLPDIGKQWKSAGDVRLPYGILTCTLQNVVATAAGSAVCANVGAPALTIKPDVRSADNTAGATALDWEAGFFRTIDMVRSP